LISTYLFWQPQALARVSVNHPYLDLRLPRGETSLLDLLLGLPESTCLRTLTWNWPLGVLRR
jgi:hypothetical protein